MSRIRAVLNDLPAGPYVSGDSYIVRRGSGFDECVIDVNGVPRWLNSEDCFDVGGAFRLNNNEVNGWGVIGPFDDSNFQDLGNATAATLAAGSGGYMRPFDIRLTHFRAIHRNNNNSAQGWGWVMSKQQQMDDHPNNTPLPLTFMMHETQGIGVTTNIRDYSNNRWQITDIDLSALPDPLLPAGEVLNLGVSAPTAPAGTNYQVQVKSGYIYWERVYS